jgi:hypothetical protein
MYCVMDCYANKSYHLFEGIQFVCEEDEYAEADEVEPEAVGNIGKAMTRPFLKYRRLGFRK